MADSRRCWQWPSQLAVILLLVTGRQLTPLSMTPSSVPPGAALCDAMCFGRAVMDDVYRHTAEAQQRAKPCSRTDPRRSKWVAIALYVSWFSILWNIGEAGFGMYFSVSSHQLALTIWAGQSLLEVLSACMVLYRVRATFTGTSGERNHEQEVERERLGQRVVGALLVLLAAYTVAHSIDSLANRAAPETTLWGSTVVGASILCMGVMWRLKSQAADILDSGVLKSDAVCSYMCMMLGVLVLLSSLVFYLVPKIWWLDAACAIVLAAQICRIGVDTIKAANALTVEVVKSGGGG